MATFMKNLTRFLSPGRPEPGAHLAAFGKHPGWNDHTDDLGLDTDTLVNAKRLLYMQGISQNIDSGAWEATTNDPSSGGSGRLERFRHDFIWHMPASPPVLLAGRLWSSVDGKGRDKYPMVLCAQFDQLPAGVLMVAFPFLTLVHERCAAAASADEVRAIVAAEREQLRKHIKDPPPQAQPLTVRELLAVARHSDLQTAAAPGGTNATAETAAQGFHRIVYGFASVLSAYRTGASRAAGRRPEQLRLPTCGLTAQDALFFWYRFAFSFLDIATPLLLFTPDQAIVDDKNSPAATWVDLIAGEPAPQNLFCIKVGTRYVPFTSDIPYTLELPFIRAVDGYLAQCATLPENSPVPAWPI